MVVPVCLCKKINIAVSEKNEVLKSQIVGGSVGLLIYKVLGNKDAVISSNKVFAPTKQPASSLQLHPQEEGLRTAGCNKKRVNLWPLWNMIGDNWFEAKRETVTRF